MISITSRIKDALWTLRQQFGLQADIDRIMPYFAFERNLNQDQLEGLFADHPQRIPEDYNSALLARIRETVRQYWQYRQTRKGYHKVRKSVIFLEDVARHGYKGCRLIENDVTGYQLELK